MITTERKRCKSKTRTGEPCRGFAMEDGYCFSHSPALEKKRLEARAKGGKNSARAARLRGLVPPRLIPVFDRLEKALVEVHTGELGKQAGNGNGSTGSSYGGCAYQWGAGGTG